MGVGDRPDGPVQEAFGQVPRHGVPRLVDVRVAVEGRAVGGAHARLRRVRVRSGNEIVPQVPDIDDQVDALQRVVIPGQRVAVGEEGERGAGLGVRERRAGPARRDGRRCGRNQYAA